MIPEIPIAAITDEFSEDIETALDAMTGLGIIGVELRVISGKNIIDLSDHEIDHVMSAIRARGMEVVSIASPLLKCTLPGGPALDPRFEQDVFSSWHTFGDQPHLAQRAFEIAERTGAPIIRVFSYWRTVEPASCFGRVVAALRNLADEALERDLIIGLENEHACNVATGAEAARVLAALDHPALKVIWDPANALVAGELPYPGGYDHLPPGRVAHIHAKDGRVKDYVITWGPLGEMDVDWEGQLNALVRDHYDGWISLETHWRGANGNKLEASRRCSNALRTLLAEACRPD
jgi:sugar phosphate isomerase/epimerase